MEEQTKIAWCKQCKKEVVFKKHEDYNNRWVCTTVGCWNWDEKENLKENPPEKRMWV
ncbi:unnamed protein product [marine sediment metagenome]|uniref:Uncharacterized protein n=1 Tax=marine sediment metagenome TaxID=412755 RepID=X0TBZ7_9ZZZZ